MKITFLIVFQVMLCPELKFGARGREGNIIHKMIFIIKFDALVVLKKIFYLFYRS